MDIMRKQNYEVMLLSETNVNTSSFEVWNGFTCFFSSSIDPKIREREEKKREQNKGVGKGRQNNSNYRVAPDFENAGVAIVVKNTLIDALVDVKQINGRLMKISFGAQCSPISFFCAYAPHSSYDMEYKEEFYNQLSDEIASTTGIYYIGGDFNARIHHVRDADKDVCGPNILGRGLQYLMSMNDKTRENRDLFLSFAKIHGTKILNSLFLKPPHKLVTYKSKIQGEQGDAMEVGPPFDAIKYAQIDFWLAGAVWKNSVVDVQSRKDIYFDSDHFIVECCIVVSALAQQKKTRDETKRYFKPSQEQWVRYNQHIKEKLYNSNDVSIHVLVQTVRTAAEKHLDKIHPDKKKTYLSRATWRKIETRNTMRRDGATSQEIRDMNKDIAKAAKIDKQTSLIEKFNDNPCDKNKKHMWKAVKDLRKKFVPQFVKMKNQAGQHVPLIKRAETVAQYLASEHWQNNLQAELPNETKIVNDNGAAETNFTLDELNQAIKATKVNKQPGPDGVVMELFKWLDRDNKAILLSLINTWWVDKKAPEELFLARVVPIYKKGDTDVAANYRPISLLNSAYKIYMMMIMSRMQDAVAQHVSKTQYGFCPGKSTSHAIYIIRRIQDFAESRSAKLSLALLDWEKAFDKVQHDKLFIALNRMGFSAHYVDVIKDCYRKPTFYVKDDYGISDQRVQSAGIRQGCPLSPFLFVLVMTCIDSDIQGTISQHVVNNRIPGLNYDMVYYADDTILYSQSNRGLNELLSLTERISKQYGLNLNRDKCVAIPMNNDGSIHFQDGTQLAKGFEATYLGNEINRDVNIQHEVLQKIQEVRCTWFKLSAYWKATRASKRWKLIVFDAIIRSKLLWVGNYPLNSVIIKEAGCFPVQMHQKNLRYVSDVYKQSKHKQKTSRNSDRDSVS